MKKIKLIFVGTILLTSVLTGCGDSVPDMTTEQSALISEYSAGLLLKYDANYNNGLMKDADIEKALADIEARKELKRKVEEAAKLRENGGSASTESSTTSNSEQSSTPENQQTAAVEQMSEKKIEDFFQLSGVQVQYVNCELLNSYPKENTDNSFFTLTSADGKQLLVMNFAITNIADADVQVNLLDQNPTFQVSIDGGTAKTVLTTMLWDDLATYSGTVAVGKPENVVLVIEVEKNVETIQSLSLIMESNGEKASCVLQ